MGWDALHHIAMRHEDYKTEVAALDSNSPSPKLLLCVRASVDRVVTASETSPSLKRDTQGLAICHPV